MQKKQVTVRVQVGELKGRVIKVPEVLGLRPTMGRVRETTMQWLRPYLPGMRVLDMFAGSGILGFEAFSLGASWVDWVDSSPHVVDAIERQRVAFGVQGQALVGRQPEMLRRLTGGYDCVFVDPPFDASLLPQTVLALKKSSLLNPGAMIYLEGPRDTLSQLCEHWVGYRLKKQGQIEYGLWKYDV